MGTIRVRVMIRVMVGVMVMVKVKIMVRARVSIHTSNAIRICQSYEKGGRDACSGAGMHAQGGYSDSAPDSSQSYR